MTNRERLLDAAKEAVGGRVAEYGGPEDSFQLIAQLWDAYLEARPFKVAPLSATDVSLMMALLKVARLAKNPSHEDSWTDLAGYAACGYEVTNRMLFPVEGQTDAASV